VSIQKNTTYNLIGALLPLGLSLITIPVYVRLIGDSRYGVLAIAWLLLGYFGLFDLGLGAATAQRIAATVTDERKERADVFWTALSMNSVLGLVGGLVIWPVANYFFARFFSVDQALRSELIGALPWLILAVPLATISGVLTGALQGRARFLELNFISVSSSSLIQLTPLVTVWLHGPDLAWLLPSVIFARLVVLSALFWLCYLHIFGREPRNISRVQAKELLQFGGWVTVSSLISPLMVVLDRFLIGATLGAKAVTFYTVPFNLAERSGMLPAALSTALFPRLAAAGEAGARQLAAAAIQSLAVVMTPLIVIGLLLMEPFLRWWLTPEFASHASLAGELLLIGFWINSFARIPYAQLQASGRPDIVAKCHVVELVPYLTLLYLGLNFWGLPGAALVFGLRTFTDCVLLLLFARTLKVCAIVLFVPLLLLMAALFVALCFSAGTMPWYASAGALLAASIIWALHNAPAVLRSVAERFVCKLKALITV
jgi:O-antigen/teichoic acid export membrane protein